ncbi:MAG: hypothetical protein KDE51_05815 [Anaerolineales bacterium]|nr:hypothetical protein [Anaerolineales bacterium]
MNAALAATNEAEAIANADLAATREAEAGAERETALVEAHIRATAEADADAQRQVAETQREEAQSSERAAQEAYSLSLAANARQALETNNAELALLLALAANKIENPPLAAWRALVDVAYAPAASKKIRFTDDIPLSFDVMPDGRYLLIGTDKGEVQLRNVGTKEIVTNLVGHEASVMSVLINDDGTRALSGESSGTAILWDLESGQLLHRLPGHSDAVVALDFLPGGNRAITGVYSEVAPAELTVWDLETGQMISRFGNTAEGNRSGLSSLAVLPDGNTVIVGIYRFADVDTPQFILWDIENEEMIQPFQTATGSSISDIAISPDERSALLASYDDNIYLFDLSTNEIVRELSGHETDVLSVVFSADGKTAVSSSGDDSIIWWEVSTGRILNRFKGHTENVRQVEFLNSNQIVSISDDQSLRVWDLHSNWEMDRWNLEAQNEGDLLTSFEMYPNGEAILAVLNWHTLITIDYESGEETVLLENFSERISTNDDLSNSICQVSSETAPLIGHQG